MRCCYSWWSAENNFIVALVLCTVAQKILRKVTVPETSVLTPQCMHGLFKNNQNNLEIKVLFDLTEM